MLDRPFSVRLGFGTNVRLVNLPARSSRVDAIGAAYDLEGQGGNSLASAAYLLEAVISGLTEPQARALNDALDSSVLGSAPGQPDTRGTVTYAPIAEGQTGQVRIYLLHR